MIHRSKQWRERAGVALAVAATATAVAACGSGTQSDTSSTSSGNGQVTLILKHITGTDENAMNAAIARYKKVAPNVTIKASYAPTDQLQTSLRAQLGGGNAPDLFVVWPGNGSAMSVQQLAPTGVLADISDQGWIKNVPDSLKPLLGDGGKTYMYSSGVTPIGDIYI